MKPLSKIIIFFSVVLLLLFMAGLVVIGIIIHEQHPTISISKFGNVSYDKEKNKLDNTYQTLMAKMKNELNIN